MNLEQSMDEVFIKKVTELLRINLQNEQFGVRELAKKMGMSRSNLHRKLQIINGKSASQFIREYRLENAMIMLKKDVATVSEISYLVGFGSPSYFNKCFHKYYGFSPGEAKFKELRDTDSEKNSTIVKDTNLQPKKPITIRIVLIIISSAVFILAISYGVFYYATVNISSKNTEVLLREKSIAVLPCINMSSEKDGQYFADGQMEAILNHLSRIAELRVISRTTMLGYRESTKSIPEIGKELDVKYVLELSVQKSDQKVNITAQLIDADTDRHLWSNNYIRDLIDIFAIQTDIAKRIAKELRTKITPSELDQIEKKPTYNFEAYNLYLKGRFLYNKDGLSEKNLKRSIYYFEQSIEIDPENAIAYAGMADVYLSLTSEGFISYSKGSEIVKKMALKAIELDNTIAEAHTTLGWLAMKIEWNWKEAEKRLKLAIELNPNYAMAHRYYARYLHVIKDRSKESREQINKALYLEPLSYNLHLTSINLFWEEGQFDQAIIESTKAVELDKNRLPAYWLNFGIYSTQGNDRKAVTELQKIMSLDTKTIKYVNIIEDIYNKSGIEGVFRWLIYFDEFGHGDIQQYSRPFYQAQKYAFLGEKEKALTLLEKCFKMRVPEIIEIRNNQFFKNLKSEDRFLKLLENMKLNNPVNE